MTDDLEKLRDAATFARMLIERVAGTADGSSWLDQVAAGAKGPDWPPEQVAAVTELLRVTGERVRHTRAVGGASASHAHSYAESPVSQSFRDRLPLNRKERYFTGTVLPMVIASDGFAHLHRFLELCGLDPAVLRTGDHALEGQQDIQLFTEYGFAESVYAPHDQNRFNDRPAERDTPDVVVAGTDWLLAVEAKMYHRPSKEALHGQLRRQRSIVEYWTRRLDLAPSQVRHVLLLPEPFARDRDPLNATVVTWEQVRDAYRSVGPAYWLGVLATALDRYDELKSADPTFRQHADELLSGEEIVEAHGSGRLVYRWMGRGGGLEGQNLRADIESGRWRQQMYELRREPLPRNDNWFSIDQFLSRTAGR